MRTSKTAAELPEWLRDGVIFVGAEENDNNSGDQGGDDSEDEDEDEDDDTEENENEGSEGKDQSNEALLKALREERKERKRLEREQKRRERAEARGKKDGQNELQQTKEDLEKARDREQKLAAGFLKSAVDRAIEKAARDAGYTDPDDAVRLIDRDDLDVDQDEDDPSKVDIDPDSVKAAVKALANKKKHLLKKGTEDGEPTGSTFGGRRGKKKQPAKEEEYRSKYPSL